MKLKKIALFFLVGAASSGLARANSKLKLNVFTASAEGFMVTSTLISGKEDAVLIDAQMTVNDAERVATAIQESKKNLTTIYITHSNPDHYF